MENNFYTRKADLLEQLAEAVSEVSELLSKLQGLERKAPDPDNFFIDEIRTWSHKVERLEEFAVDQYGPVNDLAEYSK